MSIPSISIIPPKHKIEISTVSGYAFTQENLAYGFTPSPYNDALIADIETDPFPISGTQEVATLGGLVLQPDIDVIVGIQTNSIIQQLLNSFIYTFDGFPEEEVGTSLTAEEGQVCFFDPVTVLGNNVTFSRYNCSVNTAAVQGLDKGARSQLFIFIRHLNDTLTVLHKGYIDLRPSAIVNWSPGKTIYLNSDNVLDTSPTATSGHWVRSLGFCVPNTEDKKRIWFEADSTYLRII
tara:strand:- start:2114 stop:2821 length:708 start_codon:yes stop_codon:yes gene_type:complete